MLLCIAVAAAPMTAAGAPTEAAALREALRAVVTAAGGERPDAPAHPLTPRVYGWLDFEPLWSEPERLGSLIDALEAAAGHGLDPANYGLAKVGLLSRADEAAASLGAPERAALDLAATDGLIRLAYDLRFGRIDPATIRPRAASAESLTGGDPGLDLVDAALAPSIADALAALAGQDDAYRRLQVALRDYRRIAAAGGWPGVPDGPTLEPGARDERLAALRLRLAATGDLGAADSDMDLGVYDETLEAGVRRFQRRHGLTIDGLVGASTLGALNVPADARVEQIRVNLERERWFSRLLPDDAFVINIASYRGFLREAGETVWEARVQVGEPDWQTPVLESEIRNLVLNPPWNVPRSIAIGEMLPEIRKNAAYLVRGNYQLYDRAGNAVDPHAVDWWAINARNFDYTIVQRPGPGNSLGRIKFEFPNRFSVYLHDTPAKSNFEKAERACSHGCIRLESPVALATRLLERDGWEREAVERLWERSRTETIALRKPLPIVVQYWTAGVDVDGVVHFHKDIYERDAPLAAALAVPADATSDRVSGAGNSREP